MHMLTRVQQDLPGACAISHTGMRANTSVGTMHMPDKLVEQSCCRTVQGTES